MAVFGFLTATSTPPRDNYVIYLVRVLRLNDNGDLCFGSATCTETKLPNPSKLALGETQHATNIRLPPCRMSFPWSRVRNPKPRLPNASCILLGSNHLEQCCFHNEWKLILRRTGCGGGGGGLLCTVKNSKRDPNQKAQRDRNQTEGGDF